MPASASPFNQLITNRANSYQVNKLGSGFAASPVLRKIKAGPGELQSFEPPVSAPRILSTEKPTPGVFQSPIRAKGKEFSCEPPATRRLMDGENKQREAVNRKLNAADVPLNSLSEPVKNNAKYLADLINRYYQQLMGSSTASDLELALRKQKSAMEKIEEIIAITRSSCLDQVLACANAQLLASNLKVVTLQGQVWIGKRENANAPFYISTIVRTSKHNPYSS